MDVLPFVSFLGDIEQNILKSPVVSEDDVDKYLNLITDKYTSKTFLNDDGQAFILNDQQLLKVLYLYNLALNLPLTRFHLLLRSDEKEGVILTRENLPLIYLNSTFDKLSLQQVVLLLTGLLGKNIAPNKTFSYINLAQKFSFINLSGTIDTLIKLNVLTDGGINLYENWPNILSLLVRNRISRLATIKDRYGYDITTAAGFIDALVLGIIQKDFLSLSRDQYNRIPDRIDAPFTRGTLGNPRGIIRDDNPEIRDYMITDDGRIKEYRLFSQWITLGNDLIYSVT